MSAVDETIMVRCDCAGGETVIAIDRWRYPHPFDGDQVETMVEFYTRTGSAASLTERIKVAWRVLRRREHHHDILLLSDEDQKRLGRFLLEMD